MSVIVVVACTHCKAKLRIRPEMAGRQGKCPKCHQSFEVPKEPLASEASASEPEASAEEATSTASPEKIRAAVREALSSLVIEPSSPPVIGAATCGVVRGFHYLLPPLAAGLLAYHLLMHGSWLSAAEGSPGAAAYWIVLGMLGVLTLMACLSHIGPPATKESSVCPLDANNAPLLLELVSDLSKRFDVPQAELRTSWDASLEERNGRFYIGASALANLSVTEVIGTLARCMSVRQGVLRRFTRSEFNRLHRLVRSPNDAQRKSLTARLRHAASLPGRPIVWPLAVIVRLVAEEDLRRAELKADQLQAQLLGSQRVFVAVQRHRLVRYAAQITQADLPYQFQDKSLRANRPLAVKENLQSLPEEVQQSILSIPLEEDENDLYRPTWSERLAACQQDTYPSLLDLRTPAAVLVSDFESFCRDMTWLDCQQAFGNKLKRRELIA